VALTVVPIPDRSRPRNGATFLQHDLDRAQQLKREVEVRQLPEGEPAEQIVSLARELGCGLIVLGLLEDPPPGEQPLVDVRALVRIAPCPVCLFSAPALPEEPDR
jgi:hypothetical protein